MDGGGRDARTVSAEHLRMGNYSDRRREEDEVVQAESSASTSQVVGRTRQSRSNAVYKAPLQRGNAFRESEPTPVTRGSADSALVDEATVMTVDEYERRQENERWLDGSRMADFETALAAEHQHRLAGDANPDADDLLGYRALGHELGKGLPMVTNQPSSSETSDDASTSSGPEGDEPDEAADLTEEELQAFREKPVEGHDTRPEELLDSKRRVAGLWASLKNVVKTFRDPTGNANGRRAAFTSVTLTLSAAKAGMHKWMTGAPMQLIPGVGAAVALLRIGEEVVNRLGPQLRLRDMQNEKLDELRKIKNGTDDDIALETAHMTLIAESSRRIGYSIAQLSSSLGVLVGQVAAVATAGWGLTVSAISLVAGWAAAAVEFFHNAWVQHKAAKAEAHHNEAEELMHRAEENLRLAQSVADGSEASNETVLNAQLELREAEDVYRSARFHMVAKSNHAAFTELIEQTFKPLREGEATELSPESRDHLKEYGLSSFFVLTTEAAFRNATNPADVKIDMVTAIDDVSGFLAVRRPETIGDQLLGWLTDGVSRVKRPLARLFGVDQPDELTRTDVSTLVTDKMSEPVHAAAVKASRNSYSVDFPQTRIIASLNGIAEAASQGFGAVFTELNHGHHVLAGQDGGARIINERYHWAEEFAVDLVKRKLELYSCNGQGFTPDLIEELLTVTADMNKSLERAVIGVELKPGLDSAKGWKDAMERRIPQWLASEDGNPNQWRIDQNARYEAAVGNGRLLSNESHASSVSDRVRG